MWQIKRADALKPQRSFCISLVSPFINGTLLTFSPRLPKITELVIKGRKTKIKLCDGKTGTAFPKNYYYKKNREKQKKKQSSIFKHSYCETCCVSICGKYSLYKTRARCHSQAVTLPFWDWRQTRTGLNVPTLQSHLAGVHQTPILNIKKKKLENIEIPSCLNVKRCLKIGLLSKSFTPATRPPMLSSIRKISN